MRTLIKRRLIKEKQKLQYIAQYIFVHIRHIITNIRLKRSTRVFLQVVVYQVRKYVLQHSFSSDHYDHSPGFSLRGLSFGSD
jgi:hypothetical protein